MYFLLKVRPFSCAKMLVSGSGPVVKSRGVMASLLENRYGTANIYLQKPQKNQPLIHVVRENMSYMDPMGCISCILMSPY